MANAIQTVVEKEALDGLSNLVGLLEKADALLLKTIQDGRKVNETFGAVKTPAGLGAQSAEQAKYTAELERQAKVISMLEIEVARLSKVRENNKKLSIEERVALNATNKELLRQAKLNSDLIGSYDKATIKIAQLDEQALNLGVTFGKNSPEFLKAADAAQKFKAEIFELEKAIGRNQRNVGNYKSGFNGLGNAINQITRELPAFTFSAQTGFLALSNNIPILTDQIQNLITVNKQLAAEGKPTVSIFKQIVSQVFSLNTVLALAILASTLFGDKIAAFAEKAFSGSKKINAYTESVKAIAEANVAAQKSTVEELNGLQANLSIAKDVNLSYKERAIAVKNLQDQYPFYFENLTKEQILAGDTAKAEKLLTEAILSRAKANAIVGKLTENEGKVVDLEQKKIELQKDLNDAIFENSAAVKASIGDRTRGDAVGLRSLQTTKNITTAQKALLKNQQEINELNRFSDRLTAAALVNQEKAIGLDYKQEKSKKALAKAKRDDIIAASSLLKPVDPNGIIEIFEEQIRIYKEVQKSISDTSDEYKQLQVVIDGLQQGIYSITDPMKNFEKILKPTTAELKRQAEGAKNLEDRMKALRQATDDYVNGFTTGFIEQSGFGEAVKLFDGTLTKLLAGASNVREAYVVAFEAVTEAGQQAFNSLSKLSEENFAAEKSRNELQRDLAIKYAGDDTAAKVDAQKQYEKQRIKIEERELKAKKRIAVINIAIDAAQAAVAAFKDGNIVKGIITAGIIAALAAVQIAAVNAQQVPAYFQGGVHGGGLMMVNDNPGGVKGNNYKEIVRTPDGNIHRPQGKDVLMNAPKGTEIFPTEQAYLDSVLYGKGIAPTRAVSTYAQATQRSLSPEMYMAGVNQTVGAIRKFQPTQISIDKRGMQIHASGQQAHINSMNNRQNYTGTVNP